MERPANCVTASAFFIEQTQSRRIVTSIVAFCKADLLQRVRISSIHTPLWFVGIKNPCVRAFRGVRRARGTTMAGIRTKWRCLCEAPVRTVIVEGFYPVGIHETLLRTLWVHWNATRVPACSSSPSVPYAQPHPHPRSMSLSKITHR